MPHQICHVKWILHCILQRLPLPQVKDSFRLSQAFAFGSASSPSSTSFADNGINYQGMGLLQQQQQPKQQQQQQFMITKPRMRVCFDPETEIPRLQKWFSESNHPTRQQVG